MAIKGIDVAKWNVITNYKSLKEAGVQLAIVKVINASNNPDSALYKHVEGFKGAGIRCDMGYTYSYATTTAKAVNAANAFVTYAQEVGINYMWLDLEDVSMTKLGKNIVNIINEYKAVALMNGLKFGIYTYDSFYKSHIKSYISELKNIPFWIARYPSTKDMSLNDAVPDTKYLTNGLEIAGWQYSSKGLINGVKGYIDLDVWYSDDTVSNTVEVTVDKNPFTEPVNDCNVGTIGNDANWVLWYLWRFGRLVDCNGKPDSTKIDSLYSNDTKGLVKAVQADLGFVGKDVDGIVGKMTRAAFKKLA